MICFLGPLICFDIPQGCSELSKLFYLIPPLPTSREKTGHDLSSNWAGSWFYSSCSCCCLSCFLLFAAAVAFAVAVAVVSVDVEMVVVVVVVVVVVAVVVVVDVCLACFVVCLLL